MTARDCANFAALLVIVGLLAVVLVMFGGRGTVMTRPTRLHKAHAEHEGRIEPPPLLNVSAELSCLLVAYEDCPGIASDLRHLLAEWQLRRPERGDAVLAKREASA